MSKKLVVTFIGIIGMAAITVSVFSHNVNPGIVLPANGKTGVSEDSAQVVSLPAFTMYDRRGSAVSLQSLKGKKVFVNLWATWCPPCRREMPSIERLYKSVDTAKVAFIMLSLDDNFEKAKQYVISRKIALPVFYPADDIPLLFDVEGIPASFIFNEEGKLIKQVNGSDDYDSEHYRLVLK